MTGGAEPGTTFGSLVDLDSAYLARQRTVASALAAGDGAAAADAAAAGMALRAVDADDRLWRILGPLPTDKPKPHYRYRYRHQVSDDGEGYRTADGFRFAIHPSLTARSADRIPEGWLRWAIRFAEPAAYVATAAVGAGLWLLLGDLVGSLPGVAVLTIMALLAAGLWWASAAVADLAYREAARLSQLTRLAAIGVTGAVSWAATIDAGSLTDAGRILITSVVVLVAAVGAFTTKPSADVWTVALGAFSSGVLSGSVVIAELVHDAPDAVASAQLGALVLAIIGIPLATKTARIRWIPFAVPAIGVIAGWALLGVLIESPTDAHAVLAVVGGTAAAGSALFSGSILPGPLRTVHRTVAATLAALSALVLVARTPWAWLEDIPLPVILIVTGSLILVVIGFVVRAAVRRLDDETPPSGS